VGDEVRPPSVGGVLLTGGRSERLGTDKATLVLDGDTLALRAARRLAATCDVAVEVGPGVSGLRSVRESPPYAGPLAALVAGTAALGTGMPCVLLAVDLPFVDEPLLRWLARWPADETVIPVAGGRAQLACARWSVAALREATHLRAAGCSALRDVERAVPVTYVDEHEWGSITSIDAFTDVDTRADAQRLGLQDPQ
jgi:molybdopterin-guanine dinucleotide biosynthesis protein A